jgi:hypothetical protein
MWADLDGNTSKGEPGSGTEASNTDDEATNKGDEFRGTWWAPQGRCEPDSHDMNPTARRTRFRYHEHDESSTVGQEIP